MPEGVSNYPRWDGQLRSGGGWIAVARGQVRQALRSTWARLAILLGLAWGIASIVQTYQFRQDGIEMHELQWFLDMMHQLRWFVLGVAAAVGGPALMEDARRGALELYLARGVDRAGYLLGKCIALLALTTFVMLAPALVYFGSVYLFYDDHPDGWTRALLGALLYSLQWAILVSGLALGLSAISRSSRAAALFLFGGFVGLDIVIGGLLTGLTENADLAVISPFAANAQLTDWWFGLSGLEIPLPHAFPVWWGAIAWLALSVAGWAMFAWRHPRVRGDA